METDKQVTITTETSNDIEASIYKPEQEEQEDNISENELSEIQNLVIEDEKPTFFNISDMSKEKRSIIRQIRKYREIFHNDIITLKPFISDEKLVTYDEQYLKNLLIEIDDEISSVESVKTINNFIGSGLSLYENTFVYFGIDIEGFKTDLLSDKSFNNAIARLVIRSDINLSPEKTIILKIIENTYKHWNKPMKKTSPTKINVKSTDIEKYKDL